MNLILLLVGLGCLFWALVIGCDDEEIDIKVRALALTLVFISTITILASVLSFIFYSIEHYS